MATSIQKCGKLLIVLSLDVSTSERWTMFWASQKNLELVKKKKEEEGTQTSAATRDWVVHWIGKSLLILSSVDDSELCANDCDMWARPAGGTLIWAISTWFAAKVLGGNKEAADLLASAVHQTIPGDIDPRLKENQTEVSAEDLGVWIDPIGRSVSLISVLYPHMWHNRKCHKKNGLTEAKRNCFTTWQSENPFAKCEKRSNLLRLFQ